MPGQPDMQPLEPFFSSVNYHLCMFLHPHHMVHRTGIGCAKKKHMYAKSLTDADVLPDLSGAASRQPAFVHSVGRGRYFEQLARASTFQVGRCTCVLVGRRAERSTRLTLCLSVIAGGKQEL